MLHPIGLIYKLNNGLVSRSLDGLSDDEVWQPPPGGGNPVGWILGHITETRVALLGLLGRTAATGWTPAFTRGSVRADRASYPSRQTIEVAWQNTHAGMRDAFAALTPEHLQQPAAGPPLPGANTVADQLAFFAFHESYHVGQIGYVRRQLGHSSIAG